jgi:hypothetical protein
MTLFSLVEAYFLTNENGTIPIIGKTTLMFQRPTTPWASFLEKNGFKVQEHLLKVPTCTLTHK